MLLTNFHFFSFLQQILFTTKFFLFSEEVPYQAKSLGYYTKYLLKKIVALALCLVLALSLCATAFAAADTFDLYVANDSNMKDYSNVKSDASTTGGFADTELTNVAAQTNSDGSGNLEYIKDGAAGTNFFVKTTAPTVKSYAVTEHGKTAVLYYVNKVDSAEVNYVAIAEKFTNFGVKCGQVNTAVSGFNTKIDYYKVTKTSVATVAKDSIYGEADTGVSVLVGKEIVVVAGTAIDTVPHNWSVTGVKLDEKNNTVPTEVFCPVCNTKITAIYKTGKSPAGSKVEAVPGYAGYEFVKTAGVVSPTTSGSKVDSAKTFDAGIALYVGMSISAVAGSAVVIGKKKEF